jgi:hypothetical protein
LHIQRRLKNITLNTLLLSAAILVSIVFAELIVRYFVFTKDQRQTGVFAIYESNQNYYVNWLLKYNNIMKPYFEFLQPHPFLGFVMSDNNQEPGINNRGFRSRYDIPSERGSDFFQILVTGASVAAQFAFSDVRRVSDLETVLNSKYLAPDGRRFQVISAAIGAWRMPSQVSVAVLYGSAVDALISIDGFNEASVLASGGAVESPDTFVIINLFRLSLYEEIIRLSFRTLIGFRAAIQESRILSESFLALFIFDRSLALLGDNKIIAEMQRKYVTKFFAGKREEMQSSTKELHMQSFEKNLRSMNALSKAHKFHYAHFLQPMPALHKQRTEDELKPKELVGKDLYLEFEARMLALAEKEKIPFYSLTKIFIDEKDAIYSDHIHFRFLKDGSNPGDRIMAEQIAYRIAKLWGLKSKSSENVAN